MKCLAYTYAIGMQEHKKVCDRCTYFQVNVLIIFSVVLSYTNLFADVLGRLKDLETKTNKVDSDMKAVKAQLDDPRGK